MDFKLFSKKRPTIISEEDRDRLREIERKAYMEEAEKLILDRGKQRARQELSVKGNKWEIQ